MSRIMNYGTPKLNRYKGQVTLSKD